jgi:hypothetical protein
MCLEHHCLAPPPHTLCPYCTTFALETLQRFIEKREQPDRRRTAVFVAFGLGWCGFANYGVYSKLLPGISAAIRHRGWWNATWRTELVVDTLLTTPLLYYPVFYTCHAIVHSDVDPATLCDKWRRNVRAALVTRHQM